MFACCCGVGALPALVSSVGQKRDNGFDDDSQIADCWQFGIVGLPDTVGDYVVPKTGFYALSLSSYGADVNDAQNMGLGTAYYVGHFNSGQVLRYYLGSLREHGNLSSQVRFGDVFLNTRVDGKGKQLPAFLMRWIGDKFDLQPAQLVSVDAVRALGGVYVNANVFADGTDVFALNGNRVFAPSVGDWQSMPANKAHWYVQDVALNQVGTYQVYVLGDDQYRLAVNGVPVVWSNLNDLARVNNPTDVNLLRGHSHFTVSQAGIHQLLVMQVNVPDKTPSWTSVVIKQPDGSLLHLNNGWQYLETTFDCANKYIVPMVDFSLPPNYSGSLNDNQGGGNGGQNGGGQGSSSDNAGGDDNGSGGGAAADNGGGSSATDTGQNGGGSSSDNGGSSNGGGGGTYTDTSGLALVMQPSRNVATVWEYYNPRRRS